MHRSWVVISIILVIGLPLTGCGNRIELNEIGITTATGVDGKQGDWTVTYQVINPSAMSSPSGGATGGGASQSVVHTFSTHGKTIREANNISNLEFPRKLYFAHNNIILIGKKAAEEGVAEIIDGYLRNSESRETVKVLIVDGSAREFMKMLVPPDKVPGQTLVKILEEENRRGSFYPSISMYEFALKISSESGAAGVPELSLFGTEGEKLESVDIFKKTSTQAKLMLSALSVFKGDKRVGKLNQAESLGISWLTNHINGSTFSFDDVNKDTGISTFRILKAKVKITPVKDAQQFSIKVEANVSGELVESTSQENIQTSKSMNTMQQQVEQVIESQILEGWKSVQKLKVDLIGVADMIYRKHPKIWREIKDSWSEELANMDIDIEVNAVIKRPGLIQKSFSKLLGPEKDK
ncbi:Ger(x)C family spore germination protein [Paenibacillus crassostreae]|uniref:Spore gernimation protein GerC n=1 Tax=Paenibacillus crassostreae TaxID=1763538 RepID=A0A167BB87_9BACL|nr:Ger(x)C family spore germination protein [Paenibacillus crassostreae]AOZ93002.1 spore gernimation protein GerC [Paenibacillus crassostreae]OAB71909.1 spore gernimation protein GerC [Paenibacillus crassostreae]